MRLWHGTRTLFATRWSQALVVVALIVVTLLALFGRLAGQLIGATLLFAACGAVFWREWRSPFTARKESLHRALVALVTLAPASATVLAALAVLPVRHVQLSGWSLPLLWAYGLVAGSMVGRWLVVLLRWRRGDPNALPPYLKHLGYVAALAGLFILLLNMSASSHLEVVLLVEAVLLVSALLALVSVLAMPLRAPAAWYEPLLTTYASFALFTNVTGLGILLIESPAPTYFNGAVGSLLTLIAPFIVGVGLQTLAVRLIQRRMRRHAEERVTLNLPRTVLELKSLWITPEGLLWGAEPAEIPRCYVARQFDGISVIYVRADLPSAVRARLAVQSPERAFSDYAAVRAALAEDSPCEEISAHTIYTFPGTLSVPDEPEVESLPPGDPDFASAAASVEARTGYRVAAPIFAAIVDDRVVATCTASYYTHTVAEACVDTAPEYRNRGVARAMTAAWAREMRRQGKVPLFSHERDDAGLAAVARGLGLIAAMDDVVYF